MKKTIAVAVTLAGSLAMAQPAKKEVAPAKAPPAKTPVMKPAPEVAAMAKASAGYWKCAGKMAGDPADPAKMMDFKGTYRAALDPSKFWIKGEWTMAGTKVKGTMYMTYDPTAKKWYRHMMNNMGGGGYEVSTGLPSGGTEGKMVWEGEHHGMGMQHKTRMTEEVAAKSVKMTSEASMDGGKTWKTSMEMTCTK